MIKTKKLIHLLLFLFSLSYYAQMDEFDYYRPINGVNSQWHSIVIPTNDYQFLNSNMSDIRIYGITVQNDTVEAPYLLMAKQEEIKRQNMSFNMVNESKNALGFYYTFEIPSAGSINKIDLKWKQQNFDWKVKLEGSHDQNEWFTILDEYRILSIKNNATDYNFTHLNFPSSNYRYYRLKVPSKKNPLFKSANIDYGETIEGKYYEYEPYRTKRTENKSGKKTIINVKFKEPVFVSQIIIPVNDEIDYYRSFSIKEITDSTKTEKGWVYSYRNITTGVLSSLEDHVFKFNGTVLNQLKISIHNQDNQPLAIGDISAKGYAHELHVRFNKTAKYYMAYGQNNTHKAVYDLAQFSNTIPADLQSLTFGEKVTIEKKEVAKIEPLIKNKNWLWLVMGVVILILGWFTLSMISKK